jgi:glucosyl-dolichyl phosphate glucuronosyltransferase
MISIIIPTFNRSKLLRQAIASFIDQDTRQEYEILVIDNGSTDDTKQITEQAIANHPNYIIRYIYEPEPGLLSGRHQGAISANGNILTFVDDDIVADRHWLEAIEYSFLDPTVQLVGGRNLPDYEVTPPAWIEWFWEENNYGSSCSSLSLLDFGDRSMEINANYVWGLNFSIRKTALWELGGFHPDSTPKHLQHFQGDGETGLTLKANELGYKAIYQPQALIFHQVSAGRMTSKYFEQRFFFQGVCNSYSEIRVCGKELFYKQFQAKSVKRNLKQSLKNLLKLLEKLAGRYSEKKALYSQFYHSFWAGYQFHQNAVYSNPKLLDWILKSDYWEYKLPDLDS